VSGTRPPVTDPARGAARRRGERLLGLFAAGVVALNYPLLSVFAGGGLVGGVPALLLYLFSVWALLIALTALALRRPRPGPPGGGGAPGA